MIKVIIVSLMIISVFSQICPNFKTFNVSVPKLLGDWYQIASSPWSRRTFEYNCVCSFVRYGAGNNSIKLDQSCRDTYPNGRLSRYFGEAKPISTNEPGKIKVKFEGIPGE
jgi:apolipoprotein D and lipocalin family protein